MSTPSITPAQILALIGTIVGELVTQGLISNGTGKTIGGLAAIIVPAVLMLADAHVRHGRAKIAAAKIAKHEGGVTHGN